MQTNQVVNATNTLVSALKKYRVAADIEIDQSHDASEIEEAQQLFKVIGKIVEQVEANATMTAISIEDGSLTISVGGIGIITFDFPGLIEAITMKDEDEDEISAEWNSGGLPILPLGQVNLATGAVGRCTYADNVWDVWTENEGTFVLFQQKLPNCRRGEDIYWKAVITADSNIKSVRRDFRPGTEIDLFHDQDLTPYGKWQVVDVFANNQDGFNEMKKACGRNFVQMYTFK